MIEIFKEIAKIPRPSGLEDQIAEYLCDFAKNKGLKHRRDKYLNVIIWHPGSPGRETEAPIILQAHTDMVCEKNSDIKKDFLTEGIDIIIEGDIMRANGTTLGADDGAGVAMILKLLNDDSISKPPLECVFTSCEEDGLVGAANIDLSDLKGKMLLNLDSEEEGYFTVGCAGGGNVISYFEGNLTESPNCFYRATLDGLTGGHSGVDINNNRLNANIALATAFYNVMNSFDIRIASFSGGSRDNAIPRSAEVIFSCQENITNLVTDRLNDEINKISCEHKTTDPGLIFHVERRKDSIPAFSTADSHKLVKLILDLPNGVVGMCKDLPDLVETSLNLGVINTVDNTVIISHHIRSSNEEQFNLLKENMFSILNAANTRYVVNGEYPAWEMVKDSPLRDKLVCLYKSMYGKDPVVMVIHAGLECGVLGKKIPGLDAVSLGPDLKNVHSPREEMNISSANRVMEFLIKFLEK